MPGYDQDNDIDDDDEDLSKETEKSSEVDSSDAEEEEASEAVSDDVEEKSDSYETAVEDVEEPVAVTPPPAASTLSSSQQFLSDKGFSFVKTLRPGGISGGSLDIYSYHGDDAEVKKLLHDGVLLLKTESEADISKETDKAIRQRISHAKVTFQLEFQNIASVLAQNNSDDDLKRPRLLAMEFGEKKFIFNECIYQDPAEKIATNLREYIESMDRVDTVFSAYEAPDVDSIQTRRHERTAAFDKIFESMVAAQNQLHDRQLLHLDTAARNYMMLPDGGVKVIDFGASLPMNSEGCVEGGRPYPMMPVAFFDQAAILPKASGSSTSIRTDLFARRMTMMESLAVYMGFNTDSLLEREVFYKDLPGYPTSQKMQLYLASIDDTVRLTNVFNNLMAEAIQLQKNNDVRGDVVIQQLEKYKLYLTSMPQLTSVAQIRAEEDKAFTSCISLEKNIQRLTAILENPEELEKVKGDPQQLRKFVHDLDACVAECKSKGVPEKISASPAYQEFAEMKEKFKARQSEMKSEMKDESPPSTPTAKM